MKIIFLDLDKTLIDETYSPAKGKPVIEKLQKLNFLIIFNSSKTAEEQLYYLNFYKLKTPFIVENGSAIYFPENFKPETFDYINHNYFVKKIVDMNIEYILKVLKEIEKKFNIKYYSNSSINEIKKYTKLPDRLILLARKREYSETIFNTKSELLKKEIEKYRLRSIEGSRFLNITGDTDKGRGVEELYKLLNNKANLTAGVGDGLNDIPMLEKVDLPFWLGDKKLFPRGIKINSIVEIFKYLK